MRSTLLSLFAMAVATLGVAIFFVYAMDAPVRPQGPLLGNYAAAWRTAMVADKQPPASSSPLTNVTIINATGR